VSSTSMRKTPVRQEPPRRQMAGPLGLSGPLDPMRPGRTVEPFRAVLHPPAAMVLPADEVVELDLAATELSVHPDLPPVAVWGFGVNGAVTSPGPLLEGAAHQQVIIRWRNRLPASVSPRGPDRPVPQLPFATSVVDDPNGETDSVQNELGAQGGRPEDTSSAPIGWTSVHLHGAHSRADSDGWPDNMAAAGGEQLDVFDDTYDNTDIGLGKVGAHLWYHDHAMNGTRHHVFAGLAGGYLLRDPREAQLGLPTCVQDGEIHLLLQDRNLDATDGTLRLLHKTTPDTAEFFGPLTLVDGLLWPRLRLRPEVFRLRLLNGSNARAYRLHLVSVTGDDTGMGTVTVEHDRLLVIGTDGGLLWRAWQPGAEDALALAPAERLDVLVDLTELAEGSTLYLINSAQAPFSGEPAPPLDELLANGDRPGRNPYPWVARIDIDPFSPWAGRPHSLREDIAAAELNPAFRRLVHDVAASPGASQPPQLSIESHAHRIILLAETDPPGHLYLQEIIEDAAGKIALQLPGEPAPKTYRVEGWLPGDRARSDSRVSFYDRIALRPQLGQWQLWRFVNTTGDTHPIHIHQSQFQPLDMAGALLSVANGSGANLYDPASRMTSAPIVPDPTCHGRAFEPPETLGWKDVIRVDPGNVVKVAIRFDIPGRYVYHCHVLEHEDTEMMRPFVVTVMNMDDGGMGHM
jgi:FtsP/CotA-like multicopper oxidase with cupredoxin domain